MDNNYCAPLAAILRKAQGCIYLGTDEFIDVGGEVSELRRICDSQRAENEALKQEIERLTSALTDILNPLGRMQREAAANGCRLNGMAAHLMNDAQYLKEIAKETLAAKGE